MKERADFHFTDGVRQMSEDLVASSGDILKINPSVLETTFLDALRNYQKTGKGQAYFSESDMSGENELGLNLYIDVINFCYQNPYTKESYQYLSPQGKLVPRSLGLKAAMKDSGINWGSHPEVSHLSADKWSKIIQFESNKTFFLGMERGQRIASFANDLVTKGFSDMTDFLSSFSYDAEKLLPFLAESGFFEDEFQKRSQLTVNKANITLRNRFGYGIKNIETLTVMADYRLPQLMYNFGVIEISDSLKTMLLDQQIIESGSRTERALRAATVVVGEKTSKLLGITGGATDSLFWSMAVDLGLAGNLSIPHMLVPTDEY